MRRNAPVPLILLVGPAGVGKNTLIRRAAAADPYLAFIPSLTTRTMRPGESEGCPYYFVSHGYFAEQIAGNRMLEWQRVNGNYYGISAGVVEQAWLKGRIPITDVDILGAHSLLLRPDLDIYTIFVNSPSEAETRRRIEAREVGSNPALASRLQRSALEERAASLCDYLLINDVLETATQSLLSIVEAFRARERLAAALRAHYPVPRRTLVRYGARLVREALPPAELAEPDFLLPTTVEGPLESLRAALARFFVLIQLKTDLVISDGDFEVAEASTLEVAAADPGRRIIFPSVSTRSEESFQRLELATRLWEEKTSPLVLQEAGQ